MYIRHHFTYCYLFPFSKYWLPAFISLSLPMINIWTHRAILWNWAVVAQTLFYQRLEGSTSISYFDWAVAFLNWQCSVYSATLHLWNQFKNTFSLLFSKCGSPWQISETITITVSSSVLYIFLEFLLFFLHKVCLLLRNIFRFSASLGIH